MSIPESIPEDKIESYPCEACPSGNITKVGTEHYQCDSCDWEHKENLNKESESNVYKNEK